jgi:hypothetical protein
MFGKMIPDALSDRTIPLGRVAVPARLRAVGEPVAAWPVWRACGEFARGLGAVCALFGADRRLIDA